MHMAAENGHFHIIEAILEKLSPDANPNPPNKNGKTPLMYARENGYHDIVQILEGPDEHYRQQEWERDNAKLLRQQDIHEQRLDTYWNHYNEEISILKQHPHFKKTGSLSENN